MYQIYPDSTQLKIIQAFNQMKLMSYRCHFVYWWEIKFKMARKGGINIH